MIKIIRGHCVPSFRIAATPTIFPSVTVAVTRHGCRSCRWSGANRFAYGDPLLDEESAVRRRAGEHATSRP